MQEITGGANKHVFKLRILVTLCKFGVSLVPRRRKDERAPGVYCMRMRINFLEILENRITNEYFRVTKTSQTYTIRLWIRISLRLQGDGVE